MPTNPNIPQGPLNRLRASVSFANNPGLNITPAYLGRAGLRLSFSGNSTVLIDTMTGVVQSPEPFLQFLLECHLLKSQAFSNLWKIQQETNTLLGPLTVRPDSRPLSPYQLDSGAILGTDGLDFSGASAEFIVRIGGSYQTNSSLWP
jgi:hypothetical protein